MPEALSVAIDLKIVDHFSAAMEGFSKLLIATSANADELQKKFERMGASFKASMAVTSMGFDTLKMLKATTDEAQRYEQQLNRLKALKLGDPVPLVPVDPYVAAYPFTYVDCAPAGLERVMSVAWHEGQLYIRGVDALLKMSDDRMQAAG